MNSPVQPQALTPIPRRVKRGKLHSFDNDKGIFWCPNSKISKSHQEEMLRLSKVQELGTADGVLDNEFGFCLIGNLMTEQALEFFKYEILI